MKIKKTITFAAAVVMAASFAVPASAASPQPPNYEFGSGGETVPGFGKSTSYTQTVAPNPDTENLRRNKDSALEPPPFGFFSGEFATDTASPYHNNLKEGYGYVDSQEYYGEAPGSSDVTVSVPKPSTPAPIMPVVPVVPDPPSYYPPIYTPPSNAVTKPSYYADGSMGTLYIHRNNKTIKVYEGESLDNMKKGIGHFTSTSAWDGNVGFAGHNRGAAAYFGFVKDIQTGDIITYQTPYGTRIYKVYNKMHINETDWTPLAYNASNIITLITCVENIPSLRWCVQAAQIG